MLDAYSISWLAGAARCRQPAFPLLPWQAEQHAREVRLLTEGLQDPAREAEAQLLRDDCRYLKVGAARDGFSFEGRGGGA